MLLKIYFCLHLFLSCHYLLCFYENKSTILEISVFYCYFSPTVFNIFFLEALVLISVRRQSMTTHNYLKQMAAEMHLVLLFNIGLISIAMF
jgi:hypothetical protein